MSISITPLMHNAIANSVYSSILSKTSKYYYFLCKTLPYERIDGNEQIEVPLSTYKYELSTRKDIISIKEITNNDVSFVITRIDWEPNLVFDRYDDAYSSTYKSYSGASSINSAKFYVLTDEYNLYVCLDNNYNGMSTVKPEGYDTTPFVLSDGYKWKFIMNVPSALRVKFLTTFHIPITNAINDIFYNNGALDTIIIDNPGSAYPDNTTAYITINSGIIPVSTLVVDVAYTISTLGNTTQAQWNTIAATTGLTYVVGSVFVSKVVSGEGTGNVMKGAGAVLEPRISTVDGQITKIDIKSGGTGYPSDTTLTVVGSGTGKFSPNTSALLTPVIVGGVISHVSMLDPGINYNQNNTTLTVQSDSGVDAHLSAVVRDGQIIDVIIDNPGHSYKSAKVTAFGNIIGSVAAKFTVSTSAGQLNTIQSNVELLTVNGSIDYIHIENSGNGYDAISIVVDGDGEGCTAEAVIENRKLTKVSITNRGSGYTFAKVNVTALGTSVPAIEAKARAIISPKYGHGKNAITQLFADTLMFYNTISNTNTPGFNFNNDYRQFGIIKNPTKFDSLLLYNDLLGTACCVVQGNVSNGTIVDDMVLISATGKKYTVVSHTNLTGSLVNILLQPNDNVIPITGQLLSNNLLAFVVATVINPSVDKYSGDILYIDNRTAFYQTEDQTVTLQTILKF